MEFKLTNIRNSINMVKEQIERATCKEEIDSLKDYLECLFRLEQDLLAIA